MNKYTAITIGPIVKSLSLARKPRELWSASYVFSYLMECIINAAKSVEIISPAILKYKKYQVGLYPDRVFFKNLELDKARKIIIKAQKVFETTLSLQNDVTDYFHIMSVTIEAATDGEAIKMLNDKLNVTELCCVPAKSDSSREILDLIQKKERSPLFQIALGSDKFPIEMLSDIASKELALLQPGQWNRLKKESRLYEKLKETEKEKLLISNEEDYFYQLLKKYCPDEYKSYHKYICVIQADGDNMGSIVSRVPDGELSKLSEDLLQFGEKVCEAIKNFGGLPIYAGGDDLLFISPIVGEKGKTIFDHIHDIDVIYKKIGDKVKVYNLQKDKKPLLTSMSYGISITYYKYPLYEALASARYLLFEKAKKEVPGKNALAWKLQKNSGSSFYGQFSKSESEAVFGLFNNVVAATTGESLVTAVSHTIRKSESLLEVFIDKDPDIIKLRLDAFYDKYMEYPSKKKAEQEYLDATKNLLEKLYKTKNIKKIIGEAYDMLRTAKFIKGVEDNHE